MRALAFHTYSYSKCYPHTNYPNICLNCKSGHVKVNDISDYLNLYGGKCVENICDHFKFEIEFYLYTNYNAHMCKNGSNINIYLCIETCSDHPSSKFYNLVE